MLTIATRTRPLAQAALCVLIAEALLTLMDALIKGLTARYPTFEIAFLRFAFGTLWASILVAYYRPGWPSAETVRSNASRSLLIVVTATCFFYALGQLPLAETVALSFLSPVLMVLFGGLLLGEKLDRSIGLALAAGLAGMLLIVGWRLGASDYQAGALWGVAAVCISTVAYALNVIVLRWRAQRDPALTIVWFQSACPSVILLIPAIWVWVAPDAADLALFALVGAIGVVGHFLLTLAFARAEAARLAPLHYSTLVWGIAFGYVFFHELPNSAALAGAVLIAGGAWLAQRKPTTPVAPNAPREKPNR